MGQSALAFTETYAFSSMTSSDVNLTSKGEAGFTVSVPVNSVATSVTMYTITDPTLNGEVRDFSRFAVSDFKDTSKTPIGFYATNGGLRTVGNGSNSSDRKWGPFVFSVLNLYEGDQVTIQVNATRTTKLFTVRSSNAKKGDVAVAAGTNFASYNGTETYTMTADGHFDISCPDGCYVVSVTIVTEHGSETIETPDADITGANLGARTITLTGHKTNADNATVTYYTIDGSTPTASSTLYSAPFSVSSTDDTDEDGTVVVKAITYKNGDLSTASEVKTLNVAVGQTIKLATPNIVFKDMVLSGGKYYKQYVFEQVATGTYGSPVITLTATLGGENISSPYNATTAGTISVVASADGYANSDAATLVVDGTSFILSRSYDFTQDSYREGLSTEGSNITITGAGVQVYRIYNTTHIDGLTLSNTNFGITKAANSDTRKGLAPRWGAGNISINNWIDGSIATLTDFVGNSVYASSTNGTFAFGSQINSNTFTDLKIYTPTDACISATIAGSGYSTIASAYALDCANLPAGLEAYKASEITASAVKLEKVTEAVAAGTGLILKGTASTSYEIPVVASGSDISATNKLQAAVTAYDCAANEVYILQTGEFHLVTAASTVPAGKAYLLASNVPSPARALAFSFDDEATGINVVNGAGAMVNGEVYNLQGQRVDAPTKGLYIVNGKKVIIK